MQALLNRCQYPPAKRNPLHALRTSSSFMYAFLRARERDALSRRFCFTRSSLEASSMAASAACRKRGDGRRQMSRQARAQQHTLREAAAAADTGLGAQHTSCCLLLHACRCKQQTADVSLLVDLADHTALAVEHLDTVEALMLRATHRVARCKIQAARYQPDIPGGKHRNRRC